MLRDRKWAPTYKTSDGSLSEQFYIPALTEAIRYDRGTGYFSAGSLVGNMRGIEGLIRNGGRMRLLVGCTLEETEVEAIRRGEDLKKQVASNLCKISLDPPDDDTKNGLELLSWMIAKNHMDIQVAVICDTNGEPVKNAIFHKKIGVVEDKAGDKIAWSGSNNETAYGQSANSESMSVYTSWGHLEHQQDTEIEFEDDWSGRNSEFVVMDVPEVVRRRLLEYAPPEGQLPNRLVRRFAITKSDHNDVWSFIAKSHKIKNGDMVGLATAPVVPWPHQVQVFRRLQSGRPAKLLIADEVGLGKTIQAGLFLRQAWLEGRRRILVMAPAGLTRQWQTELREKLNLDWPIYDGKSLTWQDTHAKGVDRKEWMVNTVDQSQNARSGREDGEGRGKPDNWTARGPVIVSSHLARRGEHSPLITNAEWDVVVLDEAHYARQTNPNNPKKRTPNKMLGMMRNLKDRTEDLILLTATPMQLHPVELYDLLALLGMPQKWDWDNFEKFYRVVRDPTAADLPFLGEMFRASESEYGSIDPSGLGVPRLSGKKALRMLGGDYSARPQAGDYDAIKKALLLCSPVTRLVSRNTRRQLREYAKTGNPELKMGERDVRDAFIRMSSGEWAAYKEVESYISKIWNTYRGKNRQAVGFALTIYRKRLASSFAALKNTLENHLKRLEGEAVSPAPYADEYEEEDPEDIVEKEEMALKELDKGEVRRLLGMIHGLPTDTKFNRLTEEITQLQRGYRQVLVFTQFTDTMDFLREEIRRRGHSVLCYSGRGGEKPGADGGWQVIKRADAKKEFQAGSADIMICTDAAAEGLNFQFCGAMINYDMPWNPMRVEQRIGRIDRIGQEHGTIRIANLFYEGTVEADVYLALRDRIDMFRGIVGTLQPILADVEGMIKNIVLDHPQPPRDFSQIEADLGRASAGLDDILAAGIDEYEPPESPVTMEDLDRIARNAGLMRYDTEPAGRGQYNMAHPDRSMRITTNRGVFENHSDSMEFWSPGSPAFPEPAQSSDSPKHETLKQLLDSLGWHC